MDRTPKQCEADGAVTTARGQFNLGDFEETERVKIACRRREARFQDH